MAHLWSFALTWCLWSSSRHLRVEAGKKSCICEGKLSVTCMVLVFYVQRLFALSEQLPASLARGSTLCLELGAATGIHLRHLRSRCSQAVPHRVKRNHGCCIKSYGPFVALAGVMWRLPPRWRPCSSLVLQWTDRSALPSIPARSRRSTGHEGERARCDLSGLMTTRLRLGLRAAALLLSHTQPSAADAKG